jgi:hypothetical protein
MGEECVFYCMKPQCEKAVEMQERVLREEATHDGSDLPLHTAAIFTDAVFGVVAEAAQVLARRGARLVLAARNAAE